MREIKFRGKRVDNGEWAYGYYAVHKMMLTGEMDYFIIVDEQRPQSIDPKTVGQYTGQNDFEEKEVYEGDILRFTVFDYNGADTQHKGIVKWVEDSCAFVIVNSLESDEGYWLYWVLQQDDEVEISGNVFENPELLEDVSL